MKLHVRSWTMSLVWLICAGWLTGCDDSIEPQQAQLQLVAADVVRNGSLQREIALSGVSRAVDRAALSFQSNGIVEQRLVRLGDVVTAGQLLATLRNPELQPALQAGAASIARLQAEREQAQRNLGRLQKLYDDDAIGEQQLEEQQTALRTLQDQLVEANANLGSSRGRVEDAALRAPFAGTVVSVLREPGEYVRAGDNVMEIAGTGALEVALQVPAVVWRTAQVGAQIPLSELSLQGLQSDDVRAQSAPAPAQHLGAELSASRSDQRTTGTTILARIKDIGQRADPRTGLYPLVLEYDPDQAQHFSSAPGQRVSALFRSVQAQQLLVDLNAIVDPTGGAPQVYQLLGAELSLASLASASALAEVQAVSVQVLGLSNGQVAIRAALKPGDLIVSAGNLSLVSGQQVRVQARAEDQATKTP
ncbi:MAG: efflux RND transporter periplasmic adaptor subunit [Gammaproteobacteria bacterium]|jgi:RND family efflux transporter MFP subunit|nr:efflux RND transporter periplasmic adaptor subunit [Gammaproteobacteria bacterium]